MLQTLPAELVPAAGQRPLEVFEFHYRSADEVDPEITYAGRMDIMAALRYAVAWCERHPGQGGIGLMHGTIPLSDLVEPDDFTLPQSGHLFTLRICKLDTSEEEVLLLALDDEPFDLRMIEPILLYTQGDGTADLYLSLQIAPYPVLN